MTHIALLAVLFVQTPGVWEKDVESARAKAAGQRLPLMVVFVTDLTLGPTLFDSHFEDADLKGWRDKCIAVAVLYEREDPWANELGLVGAPTAVLINPLEPDAKKQVLGVVGESKGREFPQILKNAYAKVHGSYFSRLATKLTDVQRPARNQKRLILLAMYDDTEAGKTWAASRDELMNENDKTLYDAAQRTMVVEVDAKSAAPMSEEEKVALAAYKAAKLPTVFFIEPFKGEVVLKIEGKLTKALLKKGLLEAVKKANLDAPQQNPPTKPGPTTKPWKGPKKP